MTRVSASSMPSAAPTKDPHAQSVVVVVGARRLPGTDLLLRRRLYHSTSRRLRLLLLPTTTTRRCGCPARGARMRRTPTSIVAPSMRESDATLKRANESIERPPPLGCAPAAYSADGTSAPLRL